MTPTPLNDWIDKHKPEDNLIWHGAALEQFAFVRDELDGVVNAGLPWTRRKNIPTVIGEHRSKSIVLPVYRFERADLGVNLYLRGNFYNWKLSVNSIIPVQVDLTGLCYTSPPVEPDYTGNPLAPVYFEGFPPELVYGYWSENACRWSAEFGNDSTLWTAMFLIMRSLGAIKPRIWHTRESHQAKLAAERAEHDAAFAAKKTEEI